MPTPVACLLNNPEMTFSRGRNDFKGSRLLLNSMSAPDPFADQFLGLMPLPMNRAAKRWGGMDAGAPDAALVPQTGIDSSHGRAMVTPTPVRKVRRVMLCDRGFIMTLTKLMSAGEDRAAKTYSTVSLNRRALFCSKTADL